MSLLRPGYVVEDGAICVASTILDDDHIYFTIVVTSNPQGIGHFLIGEMDSNTRRWTYEPLRVANIGEAITEYHLNGGCVNAKGFDGCL